jgi:hypothetical protein
VLRPESLVRRLWRLPRPEKLLAAESAIALTLACAAVRCSPRGSVRRLLRDVPPRRNGMRSGSSADSVLRMVERVAHVHPWRPLCLERALAGRGMLARRGWASTLVIGARQPDFEAHAWLEVDGRVSPPADISRFQALWRSS